MPRWEFRQVSFRWNRDRKEWLSLARDTQPEIVGASSLLAHYGDGGWELVNVVVSDYGSVSETSRPAGEIRAVGGPDLLSTTFVSSWRASGYLFYFKRPREE